MKSNRKIFVVNRGRPPPLHVIKTYTLLKLFATTRYAICWGDETPMDVLAAALLC